MTTLKQHLDRPLKEVNNISFFLPGNKYQEVLEKAAATIRCEKVSWYVSNLQEIDGERLFLKVWSSDLEVYWREGNIDSKEVLLVSFKHCSYPYDAMEYLADLFLQIPQNQMAITVPSA
jgi:hypothetical protein